MRCFPRSELNQGEGNASSDTKTEPWQVASWASIRDRVTHWCFLSGATVISLLAHLPLWHTHTHARFNTKVNYIRLVVCLGIGGCCWELESIVQPVLDTEGFTSQGQKQQNSTQLQNTHLLIQMLMDHHHLPLQEWIMMGLFCFLFFCTERTINNKKYIYNTAFRHPLVLSMYF